MSDDAIFVSFVIILGLLTQCGLLVALLVRQRSARKAKGEHQVLLQQQREQHEALLHALEGLGSHFLHAVQEFRRVVETLENVALLQQISDRVDVACARVEGCHQRLESQVEQNGMIIGRLHELVAAWSEGGSRIEEYYRELGRLLEETLRADREQRQQLLAWSQTLAMADRARSEGHDPR